MRESVREDLRRLAGPAAVLLAGAALAGTTRMLARAVRRRPPLQFRDRVAVITGGSRGLGLLMARELAAEGARIAILARDPAELDLARRELAAIGGLRVLALPCDVGNEDEVRWAIDAAAERFGRLDILINNAGIIQVGPLEHMTVADFEEAMRVHFWGPLHATLAALPHLRRRETGRIVNISSIGGRIAVPHLLPYSASKFALAGLSDGLRTELAKEGIYVTTVCPGLMRTGSHVNARFKGKRDEEFSWFAVSDSLPLTSMSGKRAARRILEGLPLRRAGPHPDLAGEGRHGRQRGGAQPRREMPGAGGPLPPRPRRRGGPGGPPRLAELLPLGPLDAHPSRGRGRGGEQRAAGGGGGVWGEWERQGGPVESIMVERGRGRTSPLT